MIDGTRNLKLYVKNHPFMPENDVKPRKCNGCSAMLSRLNQDDHCALCRRRKETFRAMERATYKGDPRPIESPELQVWETLFGGRWHGY